MSKAVRLTVVWCLCAAAMLSCTGSVEHMPTNGSLPVDSRLSSLLAAIPGSAGQARGVKLFPAAGAASGYCVFREWPRDRVRVFSGCDSGQPVENPFSFAMSGELLPLSFLERRGGLWVIAYDAARNYPSGRLPGYVSEGVDIYTFAAPGEAPVRLVDRFSLGGLDSPYYAGVVSGEVVVCSGRRCVTVSDFGLVTEWSLPDLVHYEFVEVAFAADWVDALVRWADDSGSGDVAVADFHYAWARLRPSGVQIERIPAQCIPYRLIVDSSPALWQCASTVRDFVDVLRYDLGRMPGSGWMDYGVSNREGRIAWSQVYYLSGLVQLLRPGSLRLGRLGDWSGVQQRVSGELELIARRILLVEGGLESRRYSVGRTPLLFGLHLGRVARLLAEAQAAGLGGTLAVEAHGRLIGYLDDLTQTVEQLASASLNGNVVEMHRYRRGADFWADGSNVPFNYTSAIVDGAASRPLLASDNASHLWSLMTPLLELEPLASQPTWHYWWGLGRDGWGTADDVSVNTPTYGGYTGNAHITYRTMDAVSLLRLNAASPGPVSEDVVNNFRSLVRDGRLLPWLNEVFPVSSDRVKMIETVVRRHARSSAPWEIQGQVWALEQLVGEVSDAM